MWNVVASRMSAGGGMLTGLLALDSTRSPLPPTTRRARLVPEIKYGAAAAGSYLISCAHFYVHSRSCLAIGEGIDSNKLFTAS